MPIGSEPTELESVAIYDAVGPALNAVGSDEVNPALRKTGDHKVERMKKIVSEWIPEDKGAIKFRDMVMSELERLVNGIPDYDTGYFNIEVVGSGFNRYTIAHGLNRIPTRYTIYADTQGTDEPVAGKSGVVVLASVFDNYWDGSGNVSRGVLLSHSIEGNESYITVAGDYVWSDQTSANIRVLLWR